ncbi:hypothetical protein A2765_00615 [Candidatus Kaiserbacteria bacterium RIFCSPHIGHO2_01_FULL_56_24]|uniref:Uncharacterized protein n=1 Tax=Candidatus Kaiserbacteria bacterium RIFCSPHIGHO2_01_FULL_56_24 TaxID=1798487 RepID=A0A1F6DBP0_9BACT|nr:MAG: hypothetical protein A2765_00615 [Candidatus Kaiserbacteria bacterium RIFCSPHIGHO2_01_FULL_56_24]
MSQAHPQLAQVATVMLVAVPTAAMVRAELPVVVEELPAVAELTEVHQTREGEVVAEHRHTQVAATAVSLVPPAGVVGETSTITRAATAAAGE